MSTLVKKGDDWSPEEYKAFKRLNAKYGDSIERLQHSKYDNVMAAGYLCEVVDEFGRNSPLYRDILAGIKLKVAYMANDNCREAAMAAFRGYSCLPGSEEDKQLVWKLNPSLSALAEVRNIPEGKMLYNFFIGLKGDKKFPTRDEVLNYQQSGSYLSSSERSKLKREARKQQHLQGTYTGSSQQAQPHQQQHNPWQQPITSQPANHHEGETAGDVIDTTATQVASETPFPIEKKVTSIVDAAILTDVQKIQVIVEVASSIKDLDALYADPEVARMLEKVQDKLEVISSFCSAGTTRKYV